MLAVEVGAQCDGFHLSKDSTVSDPRHPSPAGMPPDLLLALAEIEELIGKERPVAKADGPLFAAAGSFSRAARIRSS